MESEKAFSLRDFINARSTRFDAEILPFGRECGQAWVIVADRAAPGKPRAFLEPIADPDDYLRRVNAGILQVDEEYRDLIRQWLD